MLIPRAHVHVRLSGRGVELHCGLVVGRERRVLHAVAFSESDVPTSTSVCHGRIKLVTEEQLPSSAVREQCCSLHLNELATEAPEVDILLLCGRRAADAKKSGGVLKNPRTQRHAEHNIFNSEDSSDPEDVVHFWIDDGERVLHEAAVRLSDNSSCMFAALVRDERVAAAPGGGRTPPRWKLCSLREEIMWKGEGNSFVVSRLRETRR